MVDEPPPPKPSAPQPAQAPQRARAGRRGGKATALSQACQSSRTAGRKKQEGEKRWTTPQAPPGWREGLSATAKGRGIPSRHAPRPRRMPVDALKRPWQGGRVAHGQERRIVPHWRRDTGSEGSRGGTRDSEVAMPASRAVTPAAARLCPSAVRPIK